MWGFVICIVAICLFLVLLLNVLLRILYLQIWELLQLQVYCCYSLLQSFLFVNCIFAKCAFVICIFEKLASISFFYWSILCFFIGPESDHCLPLSLTNSLTHWLTNSCLVNMIDVTLRCEYANSKLVEVVTVADADAEDDVGNSLLQIWELTFGSKAKFLYRLWAQALVKIFKLRFRQDLKLQFVQHFAADIL